MKKLVSFLLAVLLISSLTIPSIAAVPETVVPLYNYTSSISASLPTINPDTNIAVCTSKVVASQYLPVKVVCELQKYTSEGWTTIKTWEATGNLQATLQKKYAVYTGYWYRVKTTGYVYNNSNVLLETTTVTSPEQFFPGT